MRVHTYVIAIDAGSAPNYDSPCVTLAVCKPRIRRKASVGDLVIAFAGKNVNPADPHAVVWAGVVSEKIEFADYWNDRRFTRKKPNHCPRPDNFYQPVAGGFAWVPNPIHGPEAQDRDTGGLYVLALKPSWRFGAGGPLMPETFGLRMIGGRRGERIVDLPDGKWKALRTWLDAQSQFKPGPTSPRSSCGPRQRRPSRNTC